MHARLRSITDLAQTEINNPGRNAVCRNTSLCGTITNQFLYTTQGVLMNKKRYAKLKSQGVCGICCVNPSDEGYKTCTRCRERARETRRKATSNWKSKGLCPRCGEKPLKGKRKCAACSEKSADFLNSKGISQVVNREPCVICGFEYSDIHHIDGNHDNNKISNLICLCPNHHRLIHLGLLNIADIPRRLLQ